MTIDGAKSKTPLKAARAHCLECCNGSFKEVELCTAKACPLWSFRFGIRPDNELKAEQGEVVLHPVEMATTAAEFHGDGNSPLKAIRRRCIDCSGGSRDDVKGCGFGPAHLSAPCALHPFRLGKNPNFKLSDEAKTALVDRLARARARS